MQCAEPRGTLVVATPSRLILSMGAHQGDSEALLRVENNNYPML